MTLRALLLGFLLVVALSSVTVFNDLVIKQTFLIANYMPVSVFGPLLVFLLVVNPLARRFGTRDLLSAPELAVITAVVMATCFVPGRGLMHHFTTVLMRPWHLALTQPAWQDFGVLDMASGMLATVTPENEDRALVGFVTGLGQPGHHISPLEIPWSAWVRPMVFWLPLMMSLVLSLLGLSLVVHRQWAHHEHLPYPIVKFANALMPRQGHASAVVQNPLFIIATLAVLLYHLNNYAANWWPEVFIPIRRTLPLGPLTALFPVFERGGGGQIMTPTIYFSVIGLSFFLSADVSLSLGLAPYVYALAAGIAAGYGVSFYGGGRNSPNIDGFLYLGSFLAMLLFIAYTGRRHYSNVFRTAIGMRPPEVVERYETWGARLFIGGFGFFVAQLMSTGVEWNIALLYSAGLVMSYTVISRIVAETGAFFVKPYLYPSMALLGLFGAQAIRPQSLLTIMLVSTIILEDAREAPMPYFVQALRLADLNGVRRGALAWTKTAAICLSLFVAIPVTLYWQYDRGEVEVRDGWTNFLARAPFDGSVWVQEKLKAQGELETAGTQRGLQWFAVLSPDPANLVALAVSFGLVLLFCWCGLRFPRWPLHPVMFLILFSFPSRVLGASFLIGWITKFCVTRYGGVGAYRSVQPLMLGLVAGEVLGALFPMVISAVFYLTTNRLPVNFAILP